MEAAAKSKKTRHFVIVGSATPDDLHDHVERTYGDILVSKLYTSPGYCGGAVEYTPRSDDE